MQQSCIEATIFLTFFWRGRSIGIVLDGLVCFLNGLHALPTFLSATGVVVWVPRQKCMAHIFGWRMYVTGHIGCVVVLHQTRVKGCGHTIDVLASGTHV